jgi:hypothetical protein
VNALDWPVPPFVLGNVPVTPDVNGKPEHDVKVPEFGMPNAGVVNDGLVVKATIVPDPLVV